MRRPRVGPVAKVVVFIHGWTGDEHSMELFSRGLPDSDLHIFPRGPFETEGGYGWVSAEAGGFPPMQVFEPACRDLIKEIDIRLAEMKVTGEGLRLVGFSQGGAAAYTLAHLYPERVEQVAVLAGFLPQVDQPADLDALRGIPFYIAHGTRDETIPVMYAKEAVKALQDAGAVVDYCESSTGHKLAAACFTRLTQFLKS